MKLEITEAMQVLERTPGTLRALLAGLDEEWIHGDYGEGTFSPFDVIGHLITGEQGQWIGRIRRIMEHGESIPFDTYDRYAHFERMRGREIRPLLEEFERLRAENLRALRAMPITEADLERRGVHPALGVVTLRNVLATWVAHDLTHLAQIAKALAWQYRDSVGPWLENLAVLRTPGTTMSAEGVERRRAAMRRG